MTHGDKPYRQPRDVPTPELRTEPHLIDWRAATCPECGSPALRFTTNGCACFACGWHGSEWDTANGPSAEEVVDEVRLRRLLEGG